MADTASINRKLDALCPKWRTLNLGQIAFLEEMEELAKTSADIGPRMIKRLDDLYDAHAG